MMNNGFNPNPYMPPMYNTGTYIPQAYGNPQSRIQSLEQQKRDIDNQISMLQQQQTNQGQLPQININNQIPTTPQPQQSTMPMGGIQGQQQFDFKGKFFSDKKMLDEVMQENVPFIFMSSTSNEFYIKNVDGTTTKYKFEEVNDEEEVDIQSSEEVKALKKQVEQQQMALNQLLAYVQGNSNRVGFNNQVEQKESQNENISEKQNNALSEDEIKNAIAKPKATRTTNRSSVKKGND